MSDASLCLSEGEGEGRNPATLQPTRHLAPGSPLLRLPVTEVRQQLIEALSCHDVVVVSGETGSGKTTQVTPASLPACLCSVRRLPFAACPIASVSYNKNSLLLWCTVWYFPCTAAGTAIHPGGRCRSRRRRCLFRGVHSAPPHCRHQCGAAGGQ
jgi:hypothetical protein